MVLSAKSGTASPDQSQSAKTRPTLMSNQKRPAPIVNFSSSLSFSLARRNTTSHHHQTIPSRCRRTLRFSTPQHTRTFLFYLSNANILFRELLGKPRNELTYVFPDNCCPSSPATSQQLLTWCPASTRSLNSKSTSSPPALYPSSRLPCDHTSRSSSPSATTANSSRASRPSIATATWSSRTSRRCGQRLPG